MSNLDAAIRQLRWLVSADFNGRHGAMTSTMERPSNHWWESKLRRTDIEILRSYIAGVRVLEAARREVKL